MPGGSTAVHITPSPRGKQCRAPAQPPAGQGAPFQTAAAFKERHAPGRVRRVRTAARGALSDAGSGAQRALQGARGRPRVCRRRQARKQGQRAEGDGERTGGRRRSGKHQVDSGVDQVQRNRVKPCARCEAAAARHPRRPTSDGVRDVTRDQAQPHNKRVGGTSRCAHHGRDRWAWEPAQTPGRQREASAWHSRYEVQVDWPRERSSQGRPCEEGRSEGTRGASQEAAAKVSWEAKGRHAAARDSANRDQCAWLRRSTRQRTTCRPRAGGVPI